MARSILAASRTLHGLELIERNLMPSAFSNPMVTGFMTCTAMWTSIASTIMPLTMPRKVLPSSRRRVRQAEAIASFGVPGRGGRPMAARLVPHSVKTILRRDRGCA